MKLSKQLDKISESPISVIFAKAKALQEAGRDIVDFSVGESDFDTPEYIVNAGIAALREGKTRYTNVDGMADLKAAVIEKFSRENGLAFTASEIVCGSGAKSVLYAAIAAVIGEGDEVILPTPAWPSHRAMIELAGANIQTVFCGAETSYKLRGEMLEKVITDKTRLLILCSPSNPTGAVYSSTELEDLAKILRKYEDILVISDDLYEHLVFDNQKFFTLAQIAPDLAHRILTVNGVSKAYAMTGWRIGYAGGPAPWTRAITKIFSQTHGSPCTMSQVATIAALRGDQGFLQEWCAIYEARRNLLIRILSTSPWLNLTPSEGAFYVFVDMRPLLDKLRNLGRVEFSSADFASFLLEEGVALTPGEAFEAEGYLRISIATSEEMIEKGANRILNAIDKLLINQKDEG